MEILTNPDAWIALLTLTFLEIILGIDNIVFLSIVSGKLEEKDQPKARRIGLLLAMAFRIILLFGITWVMSLKKSFFDFDWGFLSGGISGQSLIIFGGGLFLLYKSVSEIHHKLEGEDEGTSGKASNSLGAAILQIALLNIVFSFDSILTAIGLVSAAEPPVGFGPAGAIEIMIMAIIISIIIMMIFAGPVSKFVNNHPTIQILGLSFLILIGVMLLAEGSHLANFKFFGGEEVHSIPKGYLYFSIFFSLFVEFLNLKMKKNSKKPVVLHNSKIMDKKLEDSDVTN
ncbi:TerC family protein [Flavobacterium facile]|uniref:TerC family protein n=1 Tax=Flavobacterium facile TaxID=2893174 RepID=UPI002E76D37E|nr:TerC family protein [Flavobacterium sp. T-12]